MKSTHFFKRFESTIHIALDTKFTAVECKCSERQYCLQKLKATLANTDYYFFQKVGVKISNTVNSSNLPVSIISDKNHLLKSGMS